MSDLARRPSMLDGVRYGAIARAADQRGAFRELWRASTQATHAGVETFRQANLSTSAPGVLRGLHLHERQLDHWIVTAGRAFVALVDVRPMLVAPSGADRPPSGADLPPPGARPIVETRELVTDDWVDIPRGVAHGFLALEPLELVYLVTNEYDGSDELGFAWDDPLAAVPWPHIVGTADGRPILSDRDRANPSLTELVARLRDPA